MIALFHLFKFTGHNVLSDESNLSSHSFLVETYRYYVRNSFLFMFALCSLRQTFGPNIVCHSEGYRIKQEYVDTKCFINGTMTIEDEGSMIYHHQYYQWIPLVLLLQAIAFQLPYSAWIRRYASRLKLCTPPGNCNDRNNDDDSEETKQHLLLVKEIVQSRGYGLFDKIVLLEFIYVVILAVQVVLMNEFLNRQLKFFDWRGSINLLFPESGKCFFNFYSGGEETEGKFTCLLPLNALYAKLFFFIYLLFFTMLVCHILVAALRVRTYYLGHANERWVFGILLDRMGNWIQRCEFRKAFDRSLMIPPGDGIQQQHLMSTDV